MADERASGWAVQRYGDRRLPNWRAAGPWRGSEQEAIADIERGEGAMLPLVKACSACRGDGPPKHCSVCGRDTRAIEAPRCEECNIEGGPKGELLCTFLSEGRWRCYDQSACFRRQTGRALRTERTSRPCACTWIEGPNAAVSLEPCGLHSEWHVQRVAAHRVLADADVAHWKTLYANLLREHDAWASIAREAQARLDAIAEQHQAADEVTA